jgi:hypothetical protein
MKKTYLLFIPVLLFALQSCKKDHAAQAKDQYPKLITGTWKSYRQNIKVYDISSNGLLKDSTNDFTGTNAGKSWLEIYNSDGTGYITAPPRKVSANVFATDTTSYLSYAIMGDNLTLKQSIGGTQTKSIITLTQTDLELQSTYTDMLNASWKLDINTSYKITETDYYNHQ